MANINAPKGFSPVGNLQGGSWNQQGRLYAIPTSDTTNSYAVGDVVMSLASADPDGIPFVQKWTGSTTGAALPLGIIVGIRVADSSVSLVASNLDLTQSYIPAGTRTAVRYVYVVDDPMVLFEAQFDSTSIALTDLHKNAAVTVTANQALSQSAPLSSMVLTAPAATATLPVRLLGLIQRPDNGIGPYAKVLCKWNYHEFGTTAGSSGSVAGYLGT